MMIIGVLEFLKQVNAKWDDKQLSLSGNLTLNEETQELLIQSYTNKIIDCTVDIEGDCRSRNVERIPRSAFGKAVNFNICLDINGIKIYPSVERVASERPVHPPTRMIIFNDDEQIFYDKESTQVKSTGKLKHYLNISTIWNILAKCADDQRDNQLTFLYRKKICITSSYPEAVLDIEFDGLEKLIQTLDDLDCDAHKDVKCHILQNAIVRLLGDIEQDQRFGYLLEKFTKFSIDFDDSYHAYVVGFSFDDLRKEYEEKHREYMVKINDLISTSLVRALMVPAALYLTATRTQSIFSSKDISQGLEATIVNMGIGVASLIVCLVFSFLIDNEKHSLRSIELEFNSLMGRLEDKSPQAFSTIKDFRQNVNERLRLAQTCFKSLSFFNYLAATLSIIWVLLRFIP